MKDIYKIEFREGGKEELLPDFEAEFPYIASNAELDRYVGRSAPWHWHKAIELFYMESGALEYYTPKKKLSFSTGSGGFINSNVLHMTKAISRTEKNIQRLHIFDPSLIAGSSGSRIEKRYVMPIITNPQIEIYAFRSDQPIEAEILHLIKEIFTLDEQKIGYEIGVRESLSAIWMKLFGLLTPLLEEKGKYDKNDGRLKEMLVYIHDHFADKITVSDLAQMACLSERECFRLFQSYLHTTPIKYLQSYRVQKACEMLINGAESITDIGHACGLGSSSYFGKIFREYQNCTPIEYREKWQDNHILWQK